MKLQSLTEMPDFKRQGKSVTSDQGKLKELQLDAVMSNMVIFYTKDGNFLWPAGKWMTYFMDTEDAAQRMKKGEYDYLMFVPGSMSMRWNGYAMLKDVWKKSRQAKGTEHIIGIADGHYDQEKQEIYLDNISVRPGWGRNTVGQKIMQAVKSNFNGKLTHSPTTDQGHKFLKKTGDLSHNKKDGGGEHKNNDEIKA